MCYSAMVHQDLSKLLRYFNAKRDHNAFEQYHLLLELGATGEKSELKRQLGLSRAPSARLFRWAPDENQRVYPNYFAPVLVFRNGQRLLTPMRYRIRPWGSPTEIPSKFNVFNARIDSLNTRQTWKRLYGRAEHHGLFPFLRFYEWVELKNRKVEVSFAPSSYEVMWAPALYDGWSSSDGSITFNSFAIITDNPPPEIAAAGHDRCPIFLSGDVIDDWLQPDGRSLADLYAILNQRQHVFYEHEYAA